jgi:hypothetical protein
LSRITPIERAQTADISNVCALAVQRGYPLTNVEEGALSAALDQLDAEARDA